MDAPSPIDPVKLERLPRAAWGIIGVLLLSVLYAILHIGFVRPFLWPAGAGALLGQPCRGGVRGRYARGGRG